MADAPADAGDAPIGRSDPGGPKLFGFPIWVWGVAAVGTFAVVWYLRNQSGSAASSTVGAASGLPADSGVTTTDPTTAAGLLQAMQDLSTRLASQNSSPASSVAAASQPSDPAVPTSGALPVLSTITQAVSSSHTTGGNSTALTSGGNSGIPQSVTPGPVAAAIKNFTTSPLYRHVVIPSPNVYKPPALKFDPVSIIKRVISGPVSQKTIVQPVAFNPVRARSSGNQAIS